MTHASLQRCPLARGNTPQRLLLGGIGFLPDHISTMVRACMHDVALQALAPQGRHALMLMHEVYKAHNLNNKLIINCHTHSEEQASNRRQTRKSQILGPQQQMQK